MERFTESALVRQCPKCEAGAVRGVTSHAARFTGTVVEVSCRRCGAPMGSYLPADTPEPRQRPSIPTAASVGPPRGDVDSLGDPEE